MASLRRVSLVHGRFRIESQNSGVDPRAGRVTLLRLITSPENEYVSRLFLDVTDSRFQLRILR